MSKARTLSKFTSTGSPYNDGVLDKSDVGLSNVDNTSDANKPVSTAVQTAIDGKADETITITAGTGLDGGGDLTANRTINLDSASIASLSLADSALQSGDNVSELTNDAAYIDSAGAPVQSVNGETGTVVLDAGDIGYDNTTSGLAATDVQNAIDEVSQKTVEIDALADQRLREAFRKEKSTDVAPSLLLDFAGDKQLDPRITYSRASTATYYDGQTVAKAEENLLRYSEEFDNAAWEKNPGGSISATDSEVAPDGTTTADTWLQTASPSNTGIKQTTTVQSGATVTASVYVKKITGDWVRLAIGSGSNYFISSFDLTNGVVGTDVNVGTGVVVSSSIEASTNGFYRIVLTGYIPSTTSYPFVLFVPDADNSGTRLANGSVYLWGAQLEQRDSVTAYTPTTTQPITNYIPVLQTASSGDPRFDHDPITGESKGLLIEEQRTNLLQRSEEFDDAYWTKTNVDLTPNAVIAPDGTLTADHVIETTTNANHFVRRTFVSGTQSAGTYTGSVYIKYAGSQYVSLEMSDNITGDFGSRSRFDLQQGTKVSGPGSITPVGNGWYQITTTGNKTSSTYQAQFIILIRNSTNTSDSFAGDGYSGIYIWGAQLEEGSFPTSYIKTEGSQVTRVADSASMTGTNFSDWYRPDEGTVYADMTRNIPSGSISSGNTGAILISDGTNSQSIALWRNIFRIRYNGNIEANSGTGTDPDIAFAFGLKTNDVAISINGGNASTDSSVILPTVNRLDIGNITIAANNEFLNGTIKRLAYYPIRLADATLESITT